MQHITIALDDEQIEQLRELARHMGQTPEQAAASLLGALLPPYGQHQEHAIPALTSALALSGLVDDPAIAALTEVDMDRIIAAEALDPHDE